MLPRDAIAATIQSSVARGRPALVGYLTAGFPTRRRFLENLAAVAAIPWPMVQPFNAQASPRLPMV
jgi:hypothetical protein